MYSLFHKTKTFLKLLASNKREDIHDAIIPYRIRIKSLVRSRFRLSQKPYVFMDMLEIPVTAKCTLRCKHCANLMQYYKNPQHVAFEQIRRDFLAAMNSVDFVGTVSILGGEPFTYPFLPRLLRLLAMKRGKMDTIMIVTNGTIIPKPSVLHSIYKAGAIVHISDYGALSRRKDDLIHALKEHKIPYRVRRYMWKIQSAILPEPDVNSEITRKKHSACTMRCSSLLNGRLYSCPFLANGDVLGVFPLSPENYVDILDTDEENNRAQMLRFIERSVVPPGCAYCSGNDGNGATIIPAEQTSSPIPYLRYDRK